MNSLRKKPPDHSGGRPGVNLAALPGRGYDLAMAFKIPESVLVVIHTAQLDVLLLERAGSVGLWQSVTGSRESGDADLAATARRELLEETGLSDGVLTDWRLTQRYEIWAQWRARYAPEVTHNTEHVFGFRVARRSVVRLDPAEHTAQLWLPWQEAMNKVFSPTNRDAIWQLPRRVLGHTPPA
jgi:dihydroneopterin triphosphate diphosphatase